MACDPELVGKTYPQIVWVPEIERLKQFAAVTHDTCYAVDETMMQPMAIVLATVPFGVRQVVDDRELIVDPKRLTQLLHLGEDMQWARPIRVDEALSVHTTLRALETTSWCTTPCGQCRNDASCCASARAFHFDLAGS